MKYIYYIIGVLVMITIGMVIRFSGVRVELSKPALVINDKIVTESDLDELAKFGSYHSRGKAFLDSVITRELLIQEALRHGIHKEEAFRKSVETFYEQSLVKVLIDRKFDELSPVVASPLIVKYKEMSTKTVKYSKLIYENAKKLLDDDPKSVSTMESDFENLSEPLRFSLYSLKPGDTSKPEPSEDGYIVYRLDGVSEVGKTVNAPGDAQVKAFLIDQEKRVLFNAWMEEMKQKASIQIQTPVKNDE